MLSDTNVGKANAPNHSDFNNESTLFGHPKGLIILFFTEMWERFSFYGMKAILVLFLVASVENGGFGWSNEDALTLLGVYSMMVYVMTIPGGIMADKLTGQKRAVMIGGFLLVAGHLLMAYTEKWAFFTALVLIVLGVGGLKSNISTMVGGLYKQGDKRRDAGFTIFYMGINLGSLLATLSVAYVGEKIGWHYGFSLAGFGMLLGQVVFIWGQRYLKHVGNFEPKTFVPTGGKASVSKGFSKEDWDRIFVILISFLIVIVFWTAYEQAYGLMTLFVKESIDREVLFGWEIPAAMFSSLNPAYILFFGGIVAAFWSRRANRGKNSSAIFKMAIGTIVMGLGFVFMVGATLERNATAGEAAVYWIILAYLFHTIGELCISPVALSFITKVAPKKIVASMMGLYFAVIGLGNYLASAVGKLAENLGELAIFSGLVVFTVVMGGILILFNRRINKLTHGAEDGIEENPQPLAHHSELKA